MRPVVAHYQSTYLKLSERWISVQIGAIESYDSIIFTKRRRNDVFARPDIHDLERYGWMARQYNRTAWKLIGYAPSFRAIARKRNVRALHGWFGYSGVALAGLARELRVPLITSFLGSDFTRGSNAELRRRYAGLFGYGTAFLAEGPAARDALIELGAPPARVRVAKVAVETDAYPSHRAIGIPANRSGY